MDLRTVIRQYLIDCENLNRSDGTLKIYASKLDLLARWLEQQSIQELEQVTVPLMRQFLNYLKHSDSSERYDYVVQKGRLSDSTLGTYVATVKAFFQWCVNEELLKSSPAARLQKPKVPARVRPTFTPEHIETLLACCDTDTRAGYRDYVMLLVLLDTGIRVSELCDLRVADVHQRYIKVYGKGQKEREIGIHPDVSKELWKYINKHRRSFMVESTHVFLGERGALTVSGVETIFDILKSKSGITDVPVTPHVLRHTHSKEYLKAGGDVFKLSRELGHSSVQITGNIYLSDFKSTDAIADHDRYSAINRMKLGRQKNSVKSKRGKRDK